MKIKRQKGQSIVEFALVLPFLLAFILSIVYFGFVFSDYLALNSLARTIARDAALADGNGGANYYRTNVLDNKYTSNDLPNKFYTWNPATNTRFTENTVSTSTGGTEIDSITVELTATADTSQGLGSVFSSVIGWFGTDAVENLKTMKVEYTMRKENGRN
jgi:Flp pilus assembly protein TadG